MKVLVPVKKVIDASIRVRVKADGTGVDATGVKMSMNPFDQIAVEEALRLRERGVATDVIAVTVGPSNAQDVLRTALAMGADSSILVEHADRLEPLIVAKILAAIVARESPSLVLMGKQAIDDDANQTGQMLAGLLGWPQATFASKLEVDGETATVVREVDGGLETMSLTLPAVATTDLRLNEPRYATLPNIMKAKSKPLATVAAGDLGVDLRPRLEIVSTVPPAARDPGRMLGSVDELVGILMAKLATN